MLTVSLPAGRVTPLQWVAGIVFGDMLGLPFAIATTPGPDIRISAEGRSLTLASLFPDLAAPRPEWARQIPSLPLGEWQPAPGTDSLPLLFGAATLDASETEIRCGVDILGTIFFMLSRFEEVALPDRDDHDRFPATASLAWQAGFLYRPVVDAYVDALWTLLQRLWPGLERHRCTGAVRVSCDVDQPFDRVGTNPLALLRALGGDLLRRRAPLSAARRACNFFAHRWGDYRFDPNYTFEWYMDVCEANGHRAAFYFIADHSAGAIDGSYEIYEPRILALMRRIDARGHEIGMHGSYNTFRDPAQLVRERDRLARALALAGIDAPLAGNRQHYLRWDSAETPDHLDAAGFAYDTTGSFADRPGFRYGTAHPFPMWSWQRLAPLRLIQRPLVVMECTVIAERYLAMGYSAQAVSLMLDLKQRSIDSGGDFSVLWHNSHFTNQSDFTCFREVVSSVR